MEPHTTTDLFNECRIPVLSNNAIPPPNIYANLRQQEQKGAGAIYKSHDFIGDIKRRLQPHITILQTKKLLPPDHPLLISRDRMSKIVSLIRGVDALIVTVQ